MWTTSYKGMYIHGYCDKDECRVSMHKEAHGQRLHNFKSLRAAKCWITRWHNGTLP